MNNARQLCLSRLNACRTVNSLYQIHALAIKSGLDFDPFIAGQCLLRCAVNLSGANDYARRFLLQTPNPDSFMYNTLIRGYIESDSPHESISIFSLMLWSSNSNSPVDSFTLAFTLKSAANMQCLRTGIQLHSQALIRGLNNHLFVGNTLISMYAECGCAELAHKVFNEIPDRNVVSWNAIVTAFFRCGDVKTAERVFNLMPVKDLASYNLMLAGYTKIGDFVSAKKVFDEMPMRDEVSWSTMIVGLVQYGFLEDGFVCFRNLLATGMTPNEVSLTGVICGCAQAGALQLSKILQGYVEKVGLVWNTPVNNAFIDTYSKCGSIEMARLVFERMPGEKSIVSWTSMIVGLATQGYGKEALDLFHEMEESGIVPDGIVFVVILYACSHAGLVEQGCESFDRMTNVYGIKPEMEHYGCMVDLYGRAGQLLEAYEFVNRMPFPPNDIIWRTLLGACSFYNNVKLAEVAKERLLALDPRNLSDNVLLSNIYAVGGKWKDAASVRRFMAENKLVKTPAWSMIDVGKVM